VLDLAVESIVEEGENERVFEHSSYFDTASEEDKFSFTLS
jgi:hypothetical protein